MQVLRHEGAATLHEAFDSELGRKVALVTRPAGPDAAEEDRLAFRLPRMRHLNIVSVLDAGREGDAVFVTAECTATEPLSAFLARAGRIPEFQGLALVLQLLSALDHAHARRMVHAGIDLEHVQLTPGGQLKLPPGGWTLSSDRQPNLEAVARMAQVLLSREGPRALDEVLQRAQGPLETRYARAGEFALALLAAAGQPVWNRPGAAGLPVPVEEPEPPGPVPVAQASATHSLERARRTPLHRRAGRNLVAACLLAALLVPALIGTGTFTGSKDSREAATTLPAAAPIAPLPVALAPNPATPAPPLPDPPSPVAAMAPSTDRLMAIDPPPMAPAPVARPAVPPPPRAKPTGSVRQAVASRPAPTRTSAARTRVRPAVALAPECPYGAGMLRDLCQAQQCSRPELRNAPVCVRVLAEQRAALARLRGTPD